MNRSIKVSLAGQSSVGKSTIAHRLKHKNFKEQLGSTVGLAYNKIKLDDDVSIDLWDTAGQERFQSLGVGFYRGADACLLVYDITDPHSLDNLDHWRKEFLEQVGGPMGASMGGAMGDSSAVFPFVVLGNKADKVRVL